MPVFLMSGVLLLALSVLQGGSVMAGPRGQVIRVYNTRLEEMFLRLDVNGNGRLEQSELNSHRALRRRLKRVKGRRYLLIEDLRSSNTEPSGQRLKRRFRKADRNRDQKLSFQEAQSIPWLARQFTSFDRNGDGSLTLQELWDVQRSLAPPPRHP